MRQASAWRRVSLKLKQLKSSGACLTYISLLLRYIAFLLFTILVFLLFSQALSEFIDRIAPTVPKEHRSKSIVTQIPDRPDEFRKAMTKLQERPQPPPILPFHSKPPVRIKNRNKPTQKPRFIQTTFTTSITITTTLTTKTSHAIKSFSNKSKSVSFDDSINSKTTEAHKQQKTSIALKTLKNKTKSSLKECPDDTENEALIGKINIYQTLDELNLNTLVQLHEPNSYNLLKNHYRINIEHFYLDDANLNATNKHPRFDEFWELWHTTNMSILNISKELLGRDGNRVELGGSWRPLNCTSLHKLVVIIPFRDRIPHLRVNLEYLHGVLQRQLIDYRIFVVEGIYLSDVAFNKGRLMNAGNLNL
jgi:hypothetical protein